MWPVLCGQFRPSTAVAFVVVVSIAKKEPKVLRELDRVTNTRTRLVCFANCNHRHRRCRRRILNPVNHDEHPLGSFH